MTTHQGEQICKALCSPANGFVWIPLARISKNDLHCVNTVWAPCQGYKYDSQYYNFPSEFYPKGSTEFPSMVLTFDKWHWKLSVWQLTMGNKLAKFDDPPPPSMLQVLFVLVHKLAHIHTKIFTYIQRSSHIPSATFWEGW